MAREDNADRSMREALAEKHYGEAREVPARCICLQFGSSVCTGGCGARKAEPQRTEKPEALN